MSIESVPDTAEALAALQVAGEPGVWWCARHRKVQTRLRCGRCEMPICTKCTVFGPAGARCPDCASNRSAHIFQVTPLQYALAAVVSVVVSAIAGFIVRLPMIGFFTLFYAPAAGTVVAKAVSLVIKGKRGVPLAIIVSAGVIFGALIPSEWLLVALISMVTLGPKFNAQVAILHPLLRTLINPLVWLYLALAVPGVWYWMK